MENSHELKNELIKTVKRFITQNEKDFKDDMIDYDMPIFNDIYTDDFREGMSGFSSDADLLWCRLTDFVDFNEWIREKASIRMSKVFTSQQIICMSHALEACFLIVRDNYKKIVYDFIDTFGNQFYELGDIKQFKAKISRINTIEFDIFANLLIGNTHLYFGKNLLDLFAAITDIEI